MPIMKQKLFGTSIVIILVVLSIFGLAMLGSVVGAKPKELPVAIVVADQAAALPSGGQLAVGEMLRDKLLAQKELPVKWTVVASEAEARQGLDDQEYYGALILPADLSSGVLSVASGNPKPGVVKILVNEGMNAQASTAARQVMTQAVRAVSGQLSTQVLDMAGQQKAEIPAAVAKAALTPITVQEEILHPVGVNNASGNAPGMLVQVLWIGSMACAIVLFLLGQRAIAARVRKSEVVAIQALLGIVLTGIVSGFIVWMASSWFGMELAKTKDVWLFLWMTGSAFFMVQSTLVNWLGFKAMPVLILLMFFSMPVLNLAPEFLPKTTVDWLYSWTPLRFGASGLRNVMYYGGHQPQTPNMTILAIIGGVFLILLLTSALRPGKSSAEAGVGGVPANAAK